MFIRTDDPIADYDRYDAEQQKRLDSLPKCDHCKNPIQDDTYYEIEGDNVCWECLREYCDEHYKKENENV